MGLASRGPGAASGWYWTEKAGTCLHWMPSIVWSLRLMRVISTLLLSMESGAIAKLWFCDVISTCFVAMVAEF